MSGTNLTPEKITSPFQLMAAWFAMLVLVVSILLTAAANIEEPTWAPAYLIVFTSALIVGVLACVLLMLTTYRPHLQDGKEYAEWLKDKGKYSAGLIVQPSEEMRLKTKPSKASSVKKSSISKSFLISVVKTLQSQHMVETLKNKGFNVEVYNGPFDDKESIPDIKGTNESIWIGSELSAQQVLPVIKHSARIWPDLKYLHLSNDGGGNPPSDVHGQLFIGGSTNTAKEYGLEPWSVEDLLALEDGMTTKELHNLIRSKYP